MFVDRVNWVEINNFVLLKDIEKPDTLLFSHTDCKNGLLKKYVKTNSIE